MRKLSVLLSLSRLYSGKGSFVNCWHKLTSMHSCSRKRRCCLCSCWRAPINIELLATLNYADEITVDSVNNDKHTNKNKKHTNRVHDYTATNLLLSQLLVVPLIP